MNENRLHVSQESPWGRLGWTCPPHFCQRLFPRFMQIQWVFRVTGRGPRDYTFGPWVTNLQTTENEANLLLPLSIQKLKTFQLQGASLLTSWTGPLSLNGPLWGFRSQTPIIGSHSHTPLSPCVFTPHSWTWWRLWCQSVHCWCFQSTAVDSRVAILRNHSINSYYL